MPHCTNCGAEHGEGARFCPNCGQAVTGDAPPVAPQAGRIPPQSLNVPPPQGGRSDVATKVLLGCVAALLVPVALVVLVVLLRLLGLI